MRRFELQRDTDVSGVSGSGVVAQGIQFDDGTCALRWLTSLASTGIYASAAELETIHGHGGLTRLVWLDPLPTVVFELTPADNDELVNWLTRRQDLIERLRSAPR